ncbi:MAG: hypothetical protein DRI65_13865 [Chloroflexota bacterium]|nr:MAG: hypothetical protein DRI65_13865 [Chloroflexota bacterium]
MKKEGMEITTTEKKLKLIVQGFVSEYAKVKNLYDSAGLDAKLKESALQGMANALQLQGVAIQNYANWKHIIREDKKFKSS